MTLPDDAIRIPNRRSTASGSQWKRSMAKAAFRERNYIIVRDTEAKVDVGARETKDVILGEKVNFLLGPCSSGVSLAMQVVHSEYKVMRIAGIANTEAMTVEKFTPYIFQVVPNTYMEATANTRYLVKKYPNAKKFCTIGPDYEFGRREEAAFADEIKKLVPDAEILYQAWPKPGKRTIPPLLRP